MSDTAPSRRPSVFAALKGLLNLHPAAALYRPQSPRPDMQGQDAISRMSIEQLDDLGLLSDHPFRFDRGPLEVSLRLRPGRRS